MKNEFRSLRALLASGLAFVAWAGIATAQSQTVAWQHAASRLEPKEFGTQDETVTVISALSFSNVVEGNLSPSFGAYCHCTASSGAEYYATLSLPAGAVIDSIGVNNTTDADAVMGAAIWERDRSGATTFLYGFSFPPHGWDTDFAGPLGILVPDHLDKEHVIQVEQAPSPDFQFFAWVEVHWHRTVSPPPASPSFTDVPTTDLGYQYIEALKASGITGGCGNGTTFCPDANLTRRQMAVFLAKALGLHWPN
jgi:S-layer homology domain